MLVKNALPCHRTPKSFPYARSFQIVTVIHRAYVRRILKYTLVKLDNVVCISYYMTPGAGFSCLAVLPLPLQVLTAGILAS